MTAPGGPGLTLSRPKRRNYSTIRLEQITALPLGSRVKLNPWDNQITLVKTHRYRCFPRAETSSLRDHTVHDPTRALQAVRRRTGAPGPRRQLTLVGRAPWSPAASHCQSHQTDEGVGGGPGGPPTKPGSSRVGAAAMPCFTALARAGSDCRAGTSADAPERCRCGQCTSALKMCSNVQAFDSMESLSRRASVSTNSRSARRWRRITLRARARPSRCECLPGPRRLRPPRGSPMRVMVATRRRCCASLMVGLAMAARFARHP